ncbi:MAG: PIN domain-containing protein, partial [Sphingomonadales bacterium]|nr:PIN domain-containing protein [Sphingomonadales bacterium]
MTDPAYLLDSNSCIYILEGLSDDLRDAVEAREPGVIVTSTIVWAEVMRGIDPRDKVAKGKIRRLFEAIPALPFDLAAAKAYQRVPFRRGQFDRLIAAHA